MPRNQISLFNRAQENQSRRARDTWEAPASLNARWRRNSYAPLFVVLLVWALLFLVAAIIVSIEQ